MIWLRNLARISAVLSLGLLLLMLFGGAERPPTGDEWLGLVFFPIGVGVGLLLAFWRERLGGTLALLSLAAFYLQHQSMTGSWPRGPWFACFAAPGLLFLLAAADAWSSVRRASATPRDAQHGIRHVPFPAVTLPLLRTRGAPGTAQAPAA